MAFTDLQKHQNEDADCVKIIDSVNNKTNQDCFFINKGLLMYNNGKGKSRIYLPKRLINMVYTFYHNTIFGGHLGIARTQAKISEYFYNPHLDAIVKEKVKTCKICQTSKHAQRKYEGKLISIPIEQAMNTIFIDILGPLPRSKSGNQYLLIVVDGFTRFLWMHALRDCNSRLIIQKLQKTFSEFSIPRIIVSDNASYFTSKEFKSYLFKNYIQHRRIAAYRANGNKSERFIRDISTLLRCFYNQNQTYWDQEIGNIQICLNTARNSSTGTTAFKLMFFHDCNNALSNIWNLQDFISDEISADDKRQNLKTALINVKKNIQANRKRLKYQDPKSRHPYKIGDAVLVKTHFLSKKIKKFSKKLAIKYTGPYRILYFITDVTVLVQNIECVSDVKKVHIVDLKPFRS